MDAKRKSLIEIHLAVVLFSFSGLFPKFIALPAVIIVLGRAFFSSAFLGGYMLCLKKSMRLKEQKQYYYLILMGVILAIHWTAFFLSIQLSTVAIGLLTFATFPVFVTFLEPIFFKERLKRSDVIVAIITLIGVMVVIPKFELGNDLTLGVIWGIVCGLTYAILSLLNRKVVKDNSGVLIAFYEQFVATLVLIPVFILQRPVFTFRDILLLVFLGIVFTGISHSLFINGLKNVKAQTAGIIQNLELVYGIIFAAVILTEIPSLKEIVGGLIILSTVYYSTIKANFIKE